MWKSYSVNTPTGFGHAPQRRQPRISRWQFALRIKHLNASILHLVEDRFRQIELLAYPMILIWNSCKLLNHSVDPLLLSLNDKTLIRNDAENSGVEGFRFGCLGQQRK